MTIESLQRSLESSDGAMGRILQAWQQLHLIDQHVQHFLPEDLKKHTHVAAFGDGKLILYADSNHWSAKLRFLKSDLMEKLRAEKAFCHLKSITIQVSPIPEARIQPKEKPRKEAFKLTAEQISNLKSMIDSTQNDTFKASLERFLDDFK